MVKHPINQLKFFTKNVFNDLKETSFVVVYGLVYNNFPKNVLIKWYYKRNI